MSASRHAIFISYRRRDSIYAVDRLHERAACCVRLESRLQAAGRDKAPIGSTGLGVVADAEVPPAKAGTPNEICRAVSERATQTVNWVESWQKDILSASLDHLASGRAAVARKLTEQWGDGRRKEELADAEAAIPGGP